MLALHPDGGKNEIRVFHQKVKIGLCVRIHMTDIGLSSSSLYSILMPNIVVQSYIRENKNP